ncbi:hypothetical protein Leryth_000231 [Lithospermum erythrorhizon]|nr:hypothetical protein Leryth_000231 [Lithospermum erythrorhizon]
MMVGSYASYQHTFSPMESCMMHILLLMPLIILPLTRSVSKAPTS